MRVMVFVKATEDSEKGFILTPEVKKMMQEMGKYNDELKAAGIMQTGDGFTPSSEGRRVAFNGSSRTVIDGPFKNPRHLVLPFGYGKSKIWMKRSLG